MVNGQTINIRSAGVAADGGDDSAWSGLRSMVTTRFDDILVSVDGPQQSIEYDSDR